MTLAIRSKDVNFSKVVRRLSWNSIRTSIAAEHTFGGTTGLTVKDLAGGADANIAGAPTFSSRYMTGAGSSRLRTNVNSANDETLVMVCAKQASGTNLGINNYSGTGYRGIYMSTTNLQASVNGTNVVNQAVIAALTAAVPYFFAARFNIVGATQNVKAWYGKAGVLTSYTGTSAVVTVNAGFPYSIGGDSQNFGTASRDMYYGALYSDDLVDADMAQIYADARAFFLPLNSDF